MLAVESENSGQKRPIFYPLKSSNIHSFAYYTFLGAPLSLSADSPNIYGNWFIGNYGGGAGAIVNFYNTNDFALRRSVWQLNQLLKPDYQVLEGGLLWDYSYKGATNDPAPWNHFIKVEHDTTFTNIFDIVGVLTNRYEVMSFAAQSYTTALGATVGVRNLKRTVYLGRTANPIWLPDAVHPSHPYDEHYFHSSEFRGDYWHEQGYWFELLGPEAFNLR